MIPLSPRDPHPACRLVEYCSHQLHLIFPAFSIIGIAVLEAWVTFPARLSTLLAYYGGKTVARSTSLKETEAFSPPLF